MIGYPGVLVRIKTSQNQRSPLKDAPLRNPDQSLDEEIHRIWDDEIAPLLFAVATLFLFTVMEWWKWYSKTPPQPLLFTGLTILGVLCVLFKFIPARRRVRQLRQARDGEKAVGQYLEVLRARSYAIFHDIVGQGFNVDHLLIGPAGVFTVETKTISKPDQGPTEVHYNGEQVLVGGFQPDRNPIV